MLTHKLAAKYVSPIHDFEDVCEVAEFELVEAVVRAKNALKDDGIKYYLIRCIRARLLDYVTLDHLIYLPSHGPRAWAEAKKGIHRINVTRKGPHQRDPYTQDNRTDPDVFVEFDEILEDCITSEIQRDVVTYRLARCTFQEIAVKMDMEIKPCQRYWYEYCDLVKEAYDGESVL